jgi:eukaryotic-like serine/threonine-protein kinase
VRVAFVLEREGPAPAPVIKRADAAAPRPAAAAPRVAAPRKASAVKGRLACSTRPAGAQVWVDGQNTGRQTPIALGNPLMLPLGTRQVVFKLNGKQSAPTAVTITADSVAKLINVPLH